MQVVTTIGLDIAKWVFQVHGVDGNGEVVVRRQLKRRYVLPFFKKLSPCLVGIEACATSHHWSRELQALGHTVRLMPPAYVKPYLKRQKCPAPRLDTKGYVRLRPLVANSKPAPGRVITRWRGFWAVLDRAVHRDAIRFEHIFPIALWEATVVRPVRMLSDSKAAQSRKPECLRPPLPRSAA